MVAIMERETFIGKMKRFLTRLLYAPGVQPLPVIKTSIFFTIFLLNAMVIAMVFAYLPKLVRTFGTKETEIGTIVGYIASSMFAGQLFFSLVWGYIGERIGKELALAISCFGSAISTLLFGFSSGFWWAIITRFLQGTWCLYVNALNALLEVTDKYNRPVAVTLSLSAYAIGLIIGPSIGGYLVFLSETHPETIGKDSILGKFGTLLPNLIIATMFTACGLVVLIMRYRERRIKISIKSEEAPLITIKKIKLIKKDEGLKKKLSMILRNKQCMLACFVTFVFNITAIAFNEIYPVWADTSKDYYGLELTTSMIGKSLMIAASAVIIIQPITVSQLFSKFGTKKILICSLVFQTLLYPLYPPIAYIKDNNTLTWFCLCTNIVMTRLSVGASFVGTAIIVNNSVDENFSGSANGFSNAVASLGRLIAPTLIGKLYSWSLNNIKSVNKNGMGFPFDQNLSFIVMSLLCFATALLMFCVKDERQETSSGDSSVGTSDNEDCIT